MNSRMTCSNSHKLHFLQETNALAEEPADIGESMQKDAIRAVREIHAVSLFLVLDTFFDTMIFSSDFSHFFVLEEDVY